MASGSTLSMSSTSARSASKLNQASRLSARRARAAETLHEKLELLIDLRLGLLHRDETFDQAFAVGLDDALQVRDLGVDVGDLFGKCAVFVDERAIVANR